MIGADTILVYSMGLLLFTLAVHAAVISQQCADARKQRDQARKLAEEYLASSRTANRRVIDQVGTIDALRHDLSARTAERDRALAALSPFKTFTKDPTSGRFTRRPKEPTLAG